MFCDLVGSTAISAQLDAEEWRDLVGAYLDAASAAVAEMGGHVAKKLGDGLMCLFGYPLAHGTTPSARQRRPPALFYRARFGLARSHMKNAGAKPAGARPPAPVLNSAPAVPHAAREITVMSPTLLRAPGDGRAGRGRGPRRGCSVRSPAYLWRKSAARARLRGTRTESAFPFVRASGVVAGAWGSARTHLAPHLAGTRKSPC